MKMFFQEYGETIIIGIIGASLIALMAFAYHSFKSLDQSTYYTAACIMLPC